MIAIGQKVFVDRFVKTYQTRLKSGQYTFRISNPSTQKIYKVIIQ